MTSSCLQHVLCKQCGKKGHVRLDCPQLDGTRFKNILDATEDSIFGIVKNCSKNGHLKRKFDITDIENQNDTEEISESKIVTTKKNNVTINSLSDVKVMFPNQHKRKPSISSTLFTPEIGCGNNIEQVVNYSAEDPIFISDDEEPPTKKEANNNSKACEDIVIPVDKSPWSRLKNKHDKGGINVPVSQPEPILGSWFLMKPTKYEGTIMCPSCPGKNRNSIRNSRIVRHMKKIHSHLPILALLCPGCQIPVHPTELSVHMPRCFPDKQPHATFRIYVTNPRFVFCDVCQEVVNRKRWAAHQNRRHPYVNMVTAVSSL